MAFDFWWQMALSVTALCLLALLLAPSTIRQVLHSTRREWVSAVLFGLLSALVLYVVFFVGNLAAHRLFLNGQRDIAAVYNLKQGENPWLMAVLLAAVIAPGEELFWRGYLQTQLEQRYGYVGVVLAIVAYGGVHLASGNFILIMAAVICGIFWALLFRCFRSIWLNIISHIAWDLAVFLIWPFTPN